MPPAAQSEADVMADFEARLEAKRQRIAAEESLGAATDWQKLRALKEEVLCPPPQYSNFDLDALPGHSTSYQDFMSHLYHVL